MIFCILSSYYLYEYLGKKKESLRDSRNRLTKRRFCSSYSYFRAACFLHHPGAVPRVTGVIFWISVVPTSAGRAACPCAPSFRDSPRHSCCGLIASFPGPCASSGGRLPEALFMVFQLDSKGAKACKSCRSRQELSNEYLLAKFGVDTAENKPLKICQKLAKS